MCCTVMFGFLAAFPSNQLRPKHVFSNDGIETNIQLWLRMSMYDSLVLQYQIYANLLSLQLKLAYCSQPLQCHDRRLSKLSARQLSNDFADLASFTIASVVHLPCPFDVHLHFQSFIQRVNLWVKFQSMFVSKWISVAVNVFSHYSMNAQWKSELLD